MRLVKCDIRDFRSIGELSIDFGPGCVVLIGINESGKSNILKALSLLDPTSQISPADLRLARHSEAEITSGSVDFVFNLSDLEVNEVYSTAASFFLAASLEKPIIVNDETKQAYTLREYLELRREALYEVIVPSGKRRSTYWALPPKYKVIAGWKKTQGAATSQLKLKNGDGLTVGPAYILEVNDVDEESRVLLADVEISDITKYVDLHIAKLVDTNLPKAIFWSYSDKYLLPSSVDLATFCANPDSCIPLRSMFELAGLETAKIGSAILAAQGQSHHKFIQVLKRASDAATSHIRSVWRDYRSVRIELQPNGPTLVPLVVDDEVHLDMSSRSDGFKRFVSFLLQVSAKVKTDELKDILLLVDEPEIGLHPAGARNLMRELLTIGKKNTVVYSTHSIFMIDRNCVDRHLVVERKKEVTAVWKAERSRVQDEEVLYSAMGYSIFESLKANNVIFEGWKDKQLFSVVRDSMGRSDRSVREFFQDVGMTFAEGAKDVKHVARFLELASRGCLVISDADNAGVAAKKEYERAKGWGTWVTLRDIVGGTVLTIDDLIERASVVRRANKFRLATPQLSGLQSLSESSFGASEGTIAGLVRWLKTGGMADAAFNEALEQLKDALFDGLKRDEVDDQAEALVRFVMSHQF